MTIISSPITSPVRKLAVELRSADSGGSAGRSAYGRSTTCKVCDGTFNESADAVAARELIAGKLFGGFGSGLGGAIPRSTRFLQGVLPAPQLCRDCRLQRRYAFRNDWNYYRRNCDKCHRSIISIYSPDKPYPVYCPTCFWADDWSALDFGVDYDFSKSFFQQYQELQRRVPRISIFHTFSENSDYSVHSTRNNSCYLVASVHESENLLYCDLCRSGRDCLDMYSSDRMEACYQCVFCLSCYDSEFLHHCIEVNCSTQCYDCRRSSNLVGCVGLRDKHNFFLNQPASAEECLQIRQRLLADQSFAEEFNHRYQELLKSHVYPSQWQINCEDCSGNYLRNCKHAEDCFNVRFLEDCFGIDDSSKSRDCVNAAQISSSEALYECHATAEASCSAFSHLIYNCAEMLYSDNCQAGCKNCFGCISLTRESYCILNRRYSPTDYEDMVSRIIGQMQRSGEWGEFFPVEVSPFGYQETKAAQWSPLSQAEVLKRGWKWSDYEAPSIDAARVLSGSELPSPQELLQQLQAGAQAPFVIACEVTGRPFRLVDYELEFYQRKGLPLPRRSPWQRHAERLKNRLRPRAKIIKCAVCSAETLAYLDPSDDQGSRPVIACLECYRNALDR